MSNLNSLVREHTLSSFKFIDLLYGVNMICFDEGLYALENTKLDCIVYWSALMSAVPYQLMTLKSELSLVSLSIVQPSTESYTSPIV